MKKWLIKFILLIIAWLAVLLGALGIVLPLLPATPFFILALFCFSKSAPRFQHWLLNLPGIGHGLRDWQTHKKIHKQRKPIIYSSIIISFAISIYILTGQVYLQLMLFSLMLILCFLIKKIPEF